MVGPGKIATPLDFDRKLSEVAFRTLFSPNFHKCLPEVDGEIVSGMTVDIHGVLPAPPNGGHLVVNQFRSKTISSFIIVHTYFHSN